MESVPVQLLSATDATGSSNSNSGELLRQRRRPRPSSSSTTSTGEAAFEGRKDHDSQQQQQQQQQQPQEAHRNFSDRVDSCDTTPLTDVPLVPVSAGENNHNEASLSIQQQHQCATTTATYSISSIIARQVKKDESRPSKIIIRVVFGACMFAIFSGLVYMGHLYICGLVAAIELLLFRELVRVRYSAYYERIHDTIPLFRTTQWLWFAVAIFYTYGDFVSEIIQNNTQLHYMLYYTQYFPTISFLLYSGTFVLTITTLQRDSIKFQINQLCWTVLVLCLTVGQLKYIMHNIFNGLFWFVLPCCLVFANDIMAYVSGMLWGRKFIHREFISFSPNKTWEGFIGGWFFTMIAAWHVSRFLAQYTWMTCPTNEFRLVPQSLSCELDPIFQPAQSFFPSQIFELMPNSIVKMLFPRVVEICSVKGLSFADEGMLTRCVSGEATHMHHHFELSIHNFYPIQMHALWLGLFASLVAPFGGFLASAIKRAYRIKDFDSLIPGHGGVMDRMDCQFLMSLCTWVHYNTFVKFSTVSVPKLTYMYSLLTEQQKMEFLNIVMGNADRNETSRLHIK